MHYYLVYEYEEAWLVLNKDNLEELIAIVYNATGCVQLLGEIVINKNTIIRPLADYVKEVEEEKQEYEEETKASTLAEHTAVAKVLNNRGSKTAAIIANE